MDKITTDGSFLKYPNYVILSNHIIEVHLAMRDGGSKSILREALRDEMTSKWYELSEQEKQRLWGLSADLYMLHDTETYKPVSERERSQEFLGPKLAEAMKQQDWQCWLELLRYGPDFLSPTEVAFQRGRCWQELGHDEAALLFYDHAANLWPEHVLAQVLAMHTLLRLHRLDEAVARANDYADAAATHSALLFKSADVLFASTFVMPADEAKAVYQRIIQLIQRGLDTEGENPLSGAESLKLSAYVELGLCHENLGDNAQAREAYDRALALDPDHEGALIARGVHLYPDNPQAAVTDFERAVRNNSRLVWPYFYLVHYTLVTGDYPKCLALFVRAIEKPKSPLVAAHLLEWSAIAQCELLDAENLSKVAEDIQWLFQEALSLHPDDGSIQTNYRVFQTVLAKQTEQRSWVLEEISAGDEVWRRDLQTELLAA